MSVQIPTGGTVPTDWRHPPSAGGAGALWWLAGIPLAVGLLIAWQFVVQTSAEYNAAERITGLRALLRDLPATVMLFVPIAAGLALGVRAARRGFRSGWAAIWLHGLGLFGASWVAVSSAIGEFRPDGSTTLETALLPAEFAFAAIVVALGLRAASRPARVGRKLPTARLAILVPALTLLGAAAWLTAAQATLTHHVGTFMRTGVPGSVGFAAERGTTYVVYAEGNAPAVPGELAVRVVGPSGATVASQEADGEAAYLLGWRGGRPVATFTAAEPGRYDVSSDPNLPPVDAPFAPEHPNGTLAVGDDATGWMRAHEWGSAALVLAGLVAGALLAAAGVRPRAKIR